MVGETNLGLNSGFSKVSFIFFLIPLSSIQSVSRVQLFAAPWIAAPQASLFITNSWSLLKFMPIKSVMPSNHLCYPHLPPSIFPSVRVFSNGSVLRIRWPKDWSFSFSINPSGRRKWQPTPVFLPRESHGQRSLVGCCPWGRTELDTTESTQQQAAALIISLR